ncbi:SirB2 family protein [Microbulbifer variabilis]|uniref:SirB2 family protein n=1 Tax=Microbulbifer variabilis TaxID=266805 RepID=A0ABY4VG20_9GAMM|nr:SirB2 family protein [Microbulbifer variabilis]USD23227.1 SirB2 family protein [Microbulbifer variabilis]
MFTYTLIKHTHITAAVLSLSLFLLRMGLEFSGKPHWRKTFLRWMPHANDTLLLSAAVALVVIGSWNPAVFHWLAVKVALVFGYVIAGFFALRQSMPQRTRIIAALLAMVQVGFIFYLAIQKPTL